MATLTLTAKYRKNTGLILSANELLSLYLYGVDIKVSDGTVYDTESINFYIKAAQQEIERYLNIRIQRQLVTETQNYYRDEYYTQFPLLHPTYQVRTPLTLIGLLNKIEQIVYPPEWLLTKTSNQSEYVHSINVVPNGVSSTRGNFDVVLTGITAYLGLQRYSTIPNYWTMQYESGYACNEIPYDIINVIGKFAAIPLLNIAGDLILGAGIARQSLSIDGLSQQIDSTSSATNSGYGARIINYGKEINESLERLSGVYKRINFTVL
jgi:hypothetical protein